MYENQQINDVAVDRREETVTTQQPGYVATEQVVRDVAAERRLGLFQITRIMWTALAILEVLLGLRFMLKLIGANPESGFAWFMYGLTGLFVEPFNDLVSTWYSGNTIIEVTTLIAIAVYALFFWGVVRVTRIIADHPTRERLRDPRASRRPVVQGTSVRRIPPAAVKIPQKFALYKRNGD